MEPLRYMSGFGNEFASEALPGALPRGQNTPQRCPYGLYAEQLSGAAFTAPAGANRRSWLYRIRPSVLHAQRFLRSDRGGLWATAPCAEADSIGPFRWSPTPIPNARLTFVDGVQTIATAGNAALLTGMAAHVYLVTAPMGADGFCNADGELLIVPQQGALALFTEFGRLEIGPGDISVIPRGVKFRADPTGGPARGWICENYGAPFTLPNRGAIGANGLANARDFETPVAAFEDRAAPSTLTMKWGGAFYECALDHSPLDVVAWHGNHAPCKYDLHAFCPMGALLYDHPDPSINTVLTSPSTEPGVGNVDFAIFPERWQVAEHTFRPPWHHVNVMSEFMGLIFGAYDAKGAGFEAGGMSLHNMMCPHGPDADSYERARRADLAPERLSDTLAFMFESRLPLRLTTFAAALPTLQKDYADCWSGLPARFDGTMAGRTP